MVKSCNATRARLGHDGTTMLEVLVTASVIAIALSGSVLALNSMFEVRRTAAQMFVNDLRTARMNAVTRGAHYRVTWSGETYVIERLQDTDGDGIWQTDVEATPQARELSGGVSIQTVSDAAATAGPSVEFDTRGMVTASDGSEQEDVVEVALSEAADGHSPRGTSHVEVWPSGQIYLL
jgi:type II secretory pathway pseudopilin PulG